MEDLNKLQQWIAEGELLQLTDSLDIFFHFLSVCSMVYIGQYSGITIDDHS
jgi:hypothetical protein